MHHDTRRFVGATNPDTGPVEILGLAADASREAVLWRLGAPEDPASRVYLSTPGGDRIVSGLHDAVVIESFAWQKGDGLELVAGFELSRPRLFRLDGVGRLVDAPKTLMAGAAVPAPFAERRRAEIGASADGVVLRLRDGAGNPVGAPTVVLGGPTAAQTHAADVAHVGDHAFLVALASPQGNKAIVRTVRLRCL